MHLIVHAELSWLAAQALRSRRDRAIVVAAGLAPDLDALSILGGADAFGTYHHVLTHGYVAALATVLLVGAFSRQRLLAAGLALCTFHLHLVCDLLGSGPGWPLVYLWPGSRAEWFWSGQWDLASWQNSLIAVLASVTCLGMAFPFRRTIVELFSLKADAQVVRALWTRFWPSRLPELG